MTEYKNLKEILDSLKGIVELKGDDVKIVSADKLSKEGIDKLIWGAVFGATDDIKSTSIWIIRKIASAMGLGPASIYKLYEAMGKGDVKGFTVPAINIRGVTYDTARAAFRATIKTKTAAVIFEIARSEIGYTEQRPSEYAASILAAAIKENFKNPVFIQGDHYQVKLAGYKKDPQKELSALKNLMKESIDAGFYHIDLDTSTLVDLSKSGTKEQQRANFEVAAELTQFIRGHQPKEITVALGGEIGEIGGKNANEDEFRAYMDGYREIVKNEGISKMAIQTGTVHGGVPTADGSVAKVKLDFETLEKLSGLARKEYKLAGCVQHGASTLPSELFDRFPKAGTAEIHLATEFQNMVFDDERFPGELKDRIYGYLKKEAASERKEGETDQQFFYKTRKKAWGPFKKATWSMDKGILESIGSKLEAKFEFLFKKLSVVDTESVIKKYIRPVSVKIDKPHIKEVEQFDGSD